MTSLIPPLYYGYPTFSLAMLDAATRFHAIPLEDGSPSGFRLILPGTPAGLAAQQARLPQPLTQELRAIPIFNQFLSTQTTREPSHVQTPQTIPTQPLRQSSQVPLQSVMHSEIQHTPVSPKQKFVQIFETPQDEIFFNHPFNIPTVEKPLNQENIVSVSHTSNAPVTIIRNIQPIKQTSSVSTMRPQAIVQQGTPIPFQFTRVPASQLETEMKRGFVPTQNTVDMVNVNNTPPSFELASNQNIQLNLHKPSRFQLIESIPSEVQSSITNKEPSKILVIHDFDHSKQMLNVNTPLVSSTHSPIIKEHANTNIIATSNINNSPDVFHDILRIPNQPHVNVALKAIHTLNTDTLGRNLIDVRRQNISPENIMDSTDTTSIIPKQKTRNPPIQITRSESQKISTDTPVKKRIRVRVSTSKRIRGPPRRVVSRVSAVTSEPSEVMRNPEVTLTTKEGSTLQPIEIQEHQSSPSNLRRQSTNIDDDNQGPGKSTVKTREKIEAAALEFARQAQAARYSFKSAVKDALSDSTMTRDESREDGVVEGSYSYSDGFFRRTVHYRADHSGFQVLSEKVESLGDGPMPNIDGRAEVALQTSSGVDTNYSVSAADIHVKSMDVESQEQHERRRQQQ